MRITHSRWTSPLLFAALCAAVPVAAQTAAPPPADSGASASAAPLPTDFVRRRQAGHGVFLTREQIARRHPSAALNVFAAASGVRLVPDGSGGMRVQMASRPSGQNRDLPSTFSENRGISPPVGHGGGEDDKMATAGTARTNEGAASGGPAADGCRVQYYRNGLRYFPDRESRISRDIPVASIVAVEIYRTPAETPPELRGADAECGVIVIWTDAIAAP